VIAAALSVAAVRLPRVTPRAYQPVLRPVGQAEAPTRLRVASLSLTIFVALLDDTTSGTSSIRHFGGRV